MSDINSFAIPLFGLVWLPFVRSWRDSVGQTARRPNLDSNLDSNMDSGEGDEGSQHR